MERFVNTATEIHSAFRGELISLLRAEKRVRLRLPVMLRSGLSWRKGTRKIIHVVPSLRSLIDTLLPAGQGTLREGYFARRKKWSSFFKESPCVSYAKFLLFLYLTSKILFKQETTTSNLTLWSIALKQSRAYNIAEYSAGANASRKHSLV
ncbi:hypothetical protein D8M06_19345 [Oceanobacillus halophilus]|uniref:Uncharacterized protein n=1 Tax=Oceanobacillus halophilus TaxID=930130 RepID=A0A494ZR45_9BACI|nr:hypothetical protein D8M06_19345 [Oceanobacillus halophilus]